MDSDDIKEIGNFITLITQKGFSGAMGGIGIKLLLSPGSSSGLSFDITLVVGGVLLALAATIEFLMWNSGNQILLARLVASGKEKIKIEDTLDARLKP